MPDLTYNIKISSTAELGALRDLEASLQRQIVQARALGKEYSDLEKQLAATRTQLGGFSPDASPGGEVPGLAPAGAKKPAGESAPAAPAVTGSAAATDPQFPAFKRNQQTNDLSDDAATPPTAKGIRLVGPGDGGAAVVSPQLPSPPTGEIQALTEAFAQYHAANLAALAALKAAITAATNEVKKYADRRLEDLANP